ncbi:MAG TPA: diacylglycerol kinase family protein, partial [Aggregatilineales bacterium]|nr:diacylglycerol kinase family protein [Aggregatilineales bacterium]
MQQRTLVILNPKAGGGRAGKIWAKLEPLMYEQLGDLVVAITETPSQVGEHLDEALSAGLTQIISVGGDGTNHAIVNALMKRENGGKEFVLG